MMQNKIIEIVKNDEAEQLDSISKRLKYIVDSVGVKQSHMAEKLGLSPSGLHYILNNDVGFSKNAKKIAEYLNINEQWLVTGEGNIYEENTNIKTYKIPVYYFDQLKLFYHSKKKHTVTAHDFVLSATEYPKNAIAFYIADNSFSPKFEVGDILTLEQTTDFEDGEILLVYLAKPNELTLRYAFKIGSGHSDIMLVSCNGSHVKLSAGDDDVIIGAYRECLKKSDHIAK